MLQTIGLPLWPPSLPSKESHPSVEIPVLKRVVSGRGVRVAAAVAAAAMLMFVSACKTSEGAGKDLENLGEDIQDASD